MGSKDEERSRGQENETDRNKYGLIGIVRNEEIGSGDSERLVDTLQGERLGLSDVVVAEHQVEMVVILGVDQVRDKGPHQVEAERGNQRRRNDAGANRKAGQLTHEVGASFGRDAKGVETASETQPP